MKNYLYVDNSNVWIEGKALTADEGWKIDFGRLMSFAGGSRSEVGRAVLYGSRPPESDSLWNAAKANGFEVVVHDRKPWGEKMVDTSIATDMIADSYELGLKPGRDEITLVSGDADFVPPIKQLRDRGFTVNVIFWSRAAQEIKDACTDFTELDQHIEHLRHC